MTYRLPPLGTLRTFEAAARHLSFKDAAEELFVTPSAVSRAILVLEDWLGVPLFIRGNRSLSLSPAGTVYLPYVREALATLARGTESIPGRPSRQSLTISVAPTFGARWLVPRLNRFKARHPDINIAIDTAHHQVDFLRDGVDLAIRLGRGPWPQFYALKLGAEKLVPVCAPSIAPEVCAPAHLQNFPILHVTSASEDWAAWSEAKGIAVPSPDEGVCFDTFHYAIDAAVQGLGIAIGRRPLVDAELEAGRLVEVLGPAIACETSHWLVCGQESVRRPEVMAFRDWLKEEIGGAATAMDPVSGPVSEDGESA